MKKDLSYKNTIFCIKENGQWVAGVYHQGRTVTPVKDKKQEIALIKLSNYLWTLIDHPTLSNLPIAKTQARKVRKIGAPATSARSRLRTRRKNAT